jgi:hypothetical protein
VDFKPCHRTAMTLAGTVSLPSPFPACGAVSIVIVPRGGEYETYVKITQTISAKRIITRFVRPGDVRAILTRADGSAPGGPDGGPYQLSEDIRGEISRREEMLREEFRRSAAPATAELETEWHPAAILYVPESAPVLHRDEVGVTAAVSSEDVGFSGPASPHGCCGHGL